MSTQNRIIGTCLRMKERQEPIHSLCSYLNSFLFFYYIPFYLCVMEVGFWRDLYLCCHYANPLILAVVTMQTLLILFAVTMQTLLFHSLPLCKPFISICRHCIHHSNTMFSLLCILFFYIMCYYGKVPTVNFFLSLH